MDVKVKGLKISGSSDIRTGAVRVGGDIGSGELLIGGDISMAEHSGGARYDGPYVVTPEAHDEVVLYTNGKTMKDDVTVHKVPFHETTNDSGTTVYIASEG